MSERCTKNWTELTSGRKLQVRCINRIGAE